MFLWKNIFVVLTLFTAVGATFVVAESDRKHAERLKVLLFAVMGMIVILMTPVPLLATYVFFLILLLYMSVKAALPTWSYFSLTAVSPMLDWRVSGFAGIETIIQLNTPLIAGAVVWSLWISQSRLFAQTGFKAADAAVATFIPLYSYLLNRGASFTGMSRALLETALILGGAHLAASRSKTDGSLFPLKVFALFGGALGLVAVFEALRIWPQFQHITQLKGIPWVWANGTRMGLMRAVGPFSDPITFSMFLSSCFLGTWGLWVAGYRRVLTGATAVLLLAGIVCTFSRTGGVALVTGMATFLLLRRKFSELGTLSAVALAGVYLNSLLPENVREGSTGYRIELLPAVLKVVRESPILGDNLAASSGKLESLRQGQGIIDIVNTYLSLALEGGLILLAAFLVIPLVAVAEYWRCRQYRHDFGDRLLAQVALSQLMGLMGAVVSTSLVDKNLVYVIFFAGLVTAAGANMRRSRKKGSHAPPQHRHTVALVCRWD